MQTTLQSLILRLYRLAEPLLQTRLGKALFIRAYMFYKNRFEAQYIDRLQHYITPQSYVIDVGANVGYFTLRFAQWVSQGSKVIAIEPEAENFRWLQAELQRANLAGRVDCHQAVAAEHSGKLKLQLDPHHPANHKIGAEGVEVAAVSLDELIAAAGNPQVSLIKIDVQGAEEKVLAGAQQIIARHHPTLYVEVSEMLYEFASTPEHLLQPLLQQGYAIHELTKTGVSAPLDLATALAKVAAHSYADFLFIYTGNAS